MSRNRRSGAQLLLPAWPHLPYKGSVCLITNIATDLRHSLRSSSDWFGSGVDTCTKKANSDKTKCCPVGFFPFL